MKEQIKGLPAYTDAVPSPQNVFHPDYSPNIYLASLEASPDPPYLGEVLVLYVPIMLYNVYLP